MALQHVPFLLFISIAVAQSLTRTAGISDIQGIWTLVEDRTPDTTCPLNVTHTSWNRVDGLVKVAHNTIIVDGERCDSLPLADGGKALVFYESTSFDNELNPMPDATPLPESLKEMLGASGPNMAALSSHLAYGEDFLLGYEEKNRVCGGKVVFPDKTTVFISRPFNGPMFINKYSTKLELGSRWMFIVPRFLSGACLYQQKLAAIEIPGSNPESSPIPSAEIPDQTTIDPVSVSPLPVSPELDEDMDMEMNDGGSMHDEPMTSEEEEEDEDKNESACFPSSATVLLKSGSTIPMTKLKVGDVVHVGLGQYSPVFAFSHANSKVRSQFVSISTSAGHELVVSPGHYIYVNGQATAASSVKVGDRVPLGQGGDARVTDIEWMMGVGLFNPQTLHGDIAVEGIVTSTYTMAVKPAVAEALLAPVRALFRVTGMDALASSLESGAPGFAAMMPKGSVLA